MNFKTIKARFTLWVVLYLSLVFGLTSLAIYGWIKKETRELIQQQQFSMVSSIASGLDDKLRSAHDALIGIAGAMPPDNFKNSDKAQAWLNSRAGTKSLFSNGLFLFTPQGRVLVECPQLPGRRGLDLSYREYFKKTVESGKPYISTPYASSKNGHPSIMMTAPIFAVDGHLLGIMGGAMDLLVPNGFFNTLTQTKLGKTGYLYLFSKERINVAHHDPSRTMKVDVLPGMNLLFDRAIEGFEGSGETVNSKGVRAIVSYKHLKTTNWILAAHQPVAEVYGPVYRFRRVYLAVMVCVMLTAMAGIWWLAGTVTVGLSRLTGLMQSIDPRRLLEVPHMDLEDGGSEVQQLATSCKILLKEVACTHNKLLKAQELSRIGFWELNHHSGQLVWSDHVYTILELPPGQGDSDYEAFLELVHPDDRDRLNRDWVTSLENLTSFGATHRILLPDGRLKYLREQCETQFDESGKPLVSVGIVQDITEEITRQERQSLLFKSISESGLGIFLIDRHYRIRFMNAQMKKLYGEQSNMVCYQTLGQSDAPCSYCHFDQRLHAGSHVSTEITHPDGTVFNVSALPFMDTDGTPCMLELMRDITEQKKSEQALIEAKMQAESANKAKSEFLANMSHELRTPMNGVLGMAQLLKLTDLNDEQLEYVNALKLSGENLLLIINDILDLSKIEAGKVKIESAEFNLQRCIEEVVMTQKAVISIKGLFLNVEMEIPHILIGDQLRIKQILLNLLGNAVKFTKEGGITISVLLLEQYDACAIIHMAVKDTGIGISAEVLEEIFKPFTQEDGSTTRRFGGTGLGLTISRRFAELMGGSIGVESTIGVGSCFTVIIPVLISGNHDNG
jgi:signal transduction histidine kinase